MNLRFICNAFVQFGMADSAESPYFCRHKPIFLFIRACWRNIQAGDRQQSRSNQIRI